MISTPTMREFLVRVKTDPQPYYEGTKYKQYVRVEEL